MSRVSHIDRKARQATRARARGSQIPGSKRRFLASPREVGASELALSLQTGRWVLLSTHWMPSALTNYNWVARPEGRGPGRGPGATLIEAGSQLVQKRQGADRVRVLPLPRL